MPSPVSYAHGRLDNRISLWLGYYAQATAGCQAGSNTTWLMAGSVPQPDVYLRIAPEYGGQSSIERSFGAGAPELAVEICVTSTQLDLGPKLALYQRAGVREYITVELFGERLIWRVLENGVYVAQSVPSDGILKSQVFPGLWLDLAAFWADDGAKMLAVLNQGLASEQHRQFVARLAVARTR